MLNAGKNFINCPLVRKILASIYCQPEESMIRDYSKLTDAQLEVNVLRGYEQATAEKKRRLLTAITPKEAVELMICFLNESQRRYGKVNQEAPLFKKLKSIAGKS